VAEHMLEDGMALSAAGTEDKHEGIAAACREG
jgi:hypothetical protein